MGVPDFYQDGQRPSVGGVPLHEDNAALSPLQLLSLLHHPLLLHWFAQNCLFEHPKLSPLPIGLDYHTHNGAGNRFTWPWARKSAEAQERELLTVLKSAPEPRERKMRVHVGFEGDAPGPRSSQRYYPRQEVRSRSLLFAEPPVFLSPQPPPLPSGPPPTLKP